MKVLLTSSRTNQPLTLTFACYEVRYFEAKHKLSMYNEKGKVIAWAIIDEWKKVEILHDDGHEQIIKGA